MWAVYLELMGIPVPIFAWIFYRFIFKKEDWSKIRPDLQLVFLYVVSVFWFILFF